MWRNACLNCRGFVGITPLPIAALTYDFLSSLWVFSTRSTSCISLGFYLLITGRHPSFTSISYLFSCRCQQQPSSLPKICRVAAYITLRQTLTSVISLTPTDGTEHAFPGAAKHLEVQSACKSIESLDCRETRRGGRGTNFD